MLYTFIFRILDLLLFFEIHIFWASDNKERYDVNLSAPSMLCLELQCLRLAQFNRGSTIQQGSKWLTKTRAV